VKNAITNRTTRNRVLASMAALLFVTSGIASAQAGQTYSQLKAEHPGWVQVPGALASPDCVHQIPSGATVDVSDRPTSGDVTLNGKLIAHYNTCAEASIPTRHVVQDPGTGNGWVEASQWEVSLKSGDNIDYIYGYWSVPSIPETYGALIFLFNGIEPTKQGWIMQPVLQYGDNGNFGGDYWVLASWLVHSNTDYFVSSPIGVNPGDTIGGFTWQTGVSGNTQDYLVDASDQTTGQNTTLSVWTTGNQWNWAYAGVLEAYNVTSCSEFPSGSNGIAAFVDTHVYHGYPKLDYINPEFYGAEYDYFGGGGPQCNFSVTVSGSSSSLSF
jgi:hypothetical protein